MRRRVDSGSPPAELVVFDGREYRTAKEWQAAFDAFHGARRRWLQDRRLPDGALPDYKVLGACPIDWEII